MSVKTTSCRHCGIEAMWVRSMSGQWHLYTLDPVPFTDAREGIVFHRKRGWMDAGTAWPEPKDMLPRHFHPRRRDRPGPYTLAEIAASLAGQRQPARHSRKQRVDSAS